MIPHDLTFVILFKVVRIAVAVLLVGMMTSPAAGQCDPSGAATIATCCRDAIGAVAPIEGCLLGQGGCNHDSECVGPLVCGYDNCKEYVEMPTTGIARCCGPGKNFFKTYNGSFVAGYILHQNFAELLNLNLSLF